MLMYRGIRGIYPLFPNTGGGWKWIIKFKSKTPHSRERIPIPIEKEGWVEPRVGRDDSKKGRKLLPLLGFKP